MVSPLQQLRERLGLSISEMAGALGLHYSSYFNAEGGLAGIPRKARLAIAELGVDADALADEQAAWICSRAKARRQAIMAKAEVA